MASSATTIPIPANQPVTATVTLPPGTHKVGLETGPVSFSCTSIDLNQQGGPGTHNYVDADVPANLKMTDGVAGGEAYISVDVHCHGGATDARLVITPMH